MGAKILGTLQHIGLWIGGLLILAGSILVPALFIYGSARVSSTLLPWFSLLTLIAFGLVVFVFLPLAIFRATRGFSSVALMIASLVFGATLWMEGLILTVALWGIGAAFVGTFFLGVGVVPFAMLATLFKGMWMPLIELGLLTIMTFGSRFGAMMLAASLDKDDTVIETRPITARVPGV